MSEHGAKFALPRDLFHNASSLATENGSKLNGRTDAIVWLKDKVPGFQQLSDSEQKAISDFSLLWSLFEAQILNTNGSAASICTAVEGWRDAGTLDAAAFDDALDYFRDRYFAAGQFTYHFDNLHLRAPDREPLVRAVIAGADNDPASRLMAVLIVVLRYRNNLFHGVKWQYLLQDQLDNFTAANAVLMALLERHGALDHG
jgi:hypothetical protein